MPSASGSVQRLTYRAASPGGAGSGAGRGRPAGRRSVDHHDSSISTSTASPSLTARAVPEQLRGDELDDVLVVGAVRARSGAQGRPERRAAKQVAPPKVRPVAWNPSIRIPFQSFTAATRTHLRAGNRTLSVPGYGRVPEPLGELDDVPGLAQVVAALAETRGDAAREPDPPGPLEDPPVARGTPGAGRPSAAGVRVSRCRRCARVRVRSPRLARRTRYRSAACWLTPSCAPSSPEVTTAGAWSASGVARSLRSRSSSPLSSGPTRGRTCDRGPAIAGRRRRGRRRRARLTDVRSPEDDPAEAAGDLGRRSPGRRRGPG